MERIYDHPLYYEIAFSFRNIGKEVDVFEQCIDHFSLIPVRTMVEFGCGPAPHMVELMRRGYAYIGMDLNRKMLDFAGAKATQVSLSPTLLNKNMIHFTLDSQVDFAFVLLGSLYAENSADLLSHFDSLATALRPGGIYLLDWCVQFDESLESSDSWEIERDNIRTKTICSGRYTDPTGQILEEVIRIEVEDNGKNLTFEERYMKRLIYPQEFKLLIEKTRCFEFIGWWNDWNLDDPIGETESEISDRRINRPITVIRRIS